MIYLSQPQYIEAVLKKFGLQDCNPSNTPGDTAVILKKNEENKNEDMQDIPYREAIGSLMYLMLCTRPDIANPMIKLSQYATNFNNTHWTAVKRILQYIKGTLNDTLALGNLKDTHE